MAYDSSPMRRRDPDLTDPMGQARMHPAEYQGGVGYGGEAGFREEADFHPRGFPQGDPAREAALDDVFDDPAGGEPGRDRLGVHWVWELVLLAATAALAVLVWQADADALRGENLAQLLVIASGFAMLGLAAGATLRAGAPNLAIGPVAAAAAVYVADRGAEGVATPTVYAMVAAAALALALAVLVVGLHVPAWAASLAAAGGVVVWLTQQPVAVPLASEFDPTDQGPMLFLVVMAVAVLAGLLGTLKPVRRTLGRFRPIADPARRRGVAAGLSATVALVVSMVLAVLAGVVLAAADGGPVPGSSGTWWLELTMVGLAVALVGGTSAFGRRGGVFGTVLAVLALVLFDRYQQLQDWGIALLATATVALVAGLAVTRLVELFGRPLSADAQEWEDPPAYAEQSPPAAANDMWGGGAEAWASSLPAKPVPEHPTTWDDRWGR